MTDEELDQARAEEALRLYSRQPDGTFETAPVIAARLAREGWMPVDPLMEVMKEIVNSPEEFAQALRAALAKRGLEIREKVYD